MATKGTVSGVIANMVTLTVDGPVVVFRKHCSKTTASGSSPPMPGLYTAFCWTA